MNCLQINMNKISFENVLFFRDFVTGGNYVAIHHMGLPL